MKEVLIVIFIVGVIVVSGSATAGGEKHRDFIYLSPTVNGPDGRVVYDVAIKSHGGAELTIEAIDCCLPGDKWLLVAKKKKIGRETQEVIFSGDGGYECYPIRFDKTITFPGFSEGRIIVKPVEVAVSYPASAFIKLSWNTGEVFTITIIEGADYCLE